MKIAIYGGTFNPIHIGHTSLAHSLIGQGLVDEVWIMVSPQNPFKGNNAANYDDRLEMAKIATKDLSGIKVSDFERSLPVPSYTITTLTKLSETYPEHQFCLVIGADNWKKFQGWFRADDILQNYPILVYRRPGYEIDLTSLNPKCFSSPRGSRMGVSQFSIKIVDTPLFDVSSTEIRNGEKLDMLNPSVLEYIKSHHLYF